MLRKLLFFSLLLTGFGARAQDIDVLHYSFNLTLSDKSDTLEGLALINFETLKPKASVTLDLAGRRRDGKGMVVRRVDGADVEGWFQKGDKLEILFELSSISKTYKLVQIAYAGIPADGLIISKNKWGDRTFFADNWPNRAHQWLPCNDRPDDKASFEFTVKVPEGFQLISNGTTDNPLGVPLKMVDGQTWAETLLPGRMYHWKEEIPSPTKVMVIGAAPFAVKRFPDSPRDIPVSAWVFRQDSTKGFHDYALAPSILKFFSNYIAPFPYKKLANVQSKTIFGGMENASAIFYAEESVTGDRKWEDVFAHEIAHQWFGDMATEKSFAHLWLSEGFATYMTNIYMEQKYGVDSMRKRLADDRKVVLNFVKKSKSPVVDSTSDLMSLLNANSYQKGGWVLHMLRYELGDSVFQEVIRTYYNTYKGKNAVTDDFQEVAEKVFKKPLDWFFNQWLYQPGVPEIFVKETQTGKRVILEVDQGTKPYLFTLEVGLVDESGAMTIHQLPVTEAHNRFELPKTSEKTVRVVYDPNTNLLFRQLTEPVKYIWKVTNRNTGESRTYDSPPRHPRF